MAKQQPSDRRVKAGRRIWPIWKALPYEYAKPARAKRIDAAG